MMRSMEIGERGLNNAKNGLKINKLGLFNLSRSARGTAESHISPISGYNYFLSIVIQAFGGGICSKRH